MIGYSVKQLNSKLNVLKAQLDTFQNSGHFTESEIERLSKPLIEQIQEIQKHKENENAIKN